MGRRLATAVHLEPPETHELLILQPGDEPDEVVAAAITNPDAWEEDPEALTLDDPALIGEQPPTPAFDDPEPEPTPAAEAKPRTRTRKQADEK
ncbi:hypothetical protein ACFYXS_35485 [Streptomyces sp. NPDC002574]|uniref:hypothetical protein n=1 Tax=Streptomyces sp. NPDC002574 TaxID=3364652 RepID=UPI0036C37E80